MNTSDVITAVKKWGNFRDNQIQLVFQKTTFEGIRYKKNGDPQNVKVSIFDAGQNENPEIRFYCKAVSEDEKNAQGNDKKSVQEALMAVHWEDLDK